MALTLSLVSASPALADEVAAHVAGIRSENLPVIASADRVAGASAAAQASSGNLFHADLSGLFPGCDSVAEVVGTGADIPSVFSAFRQSAPHWNILTNPGWNAMGTGQATGADGMVFVAVVFCRQVGGGSSTVAPPIGADAPVIATTPANGTSPLLNRWNSIRTCRRSVHDAERSGPGWTARLSQCFPTGRSAFADPPTESGCWKAPPTTAELAHTRREEVPSFSSLVSRFSFCPLRHRPGGLGHLPRLKPGEDAGNRLREDERS